MLAIRDGPRISSWGDGDKRKEKILNTHPYGTKNLSTKTNTQKSLFLNILRYNRLPIKTKDTKHYCFFNTIIYEKRTRCSFKSSKSSLIKSKLKVEAISFSMYNIKESVKKSFSILLQKLVLTTFITENAYSVVAVETGRVSTSLTIL